MRVKERKGELGSPLFVCWHQGGRLDTERLGKINRPRPGRKLKGRLVGGWEGLWEPALFLVHDRMLERSDGM